MSAVNPYLPPGAHVEDVAAEAEVQPVRLWSARGRIGRLRYIAYGLGAYLLLAVAIGLFSVLSALSPALGGTLIVLAVVPYIVFFVLITIQRAHDMNWTGWTAPLVLVPLVGLVWLLVNGTRGSNRFGGPPPPNTWGVRLLALVLPVVMVIGILAAVAIPAYQDYTERAQAARVR